MRAGLRQWAEESRMRCIEPVKANEGWGDVLPGLSGENTSCRCLDMLDSV